MRKVCRLAREVLDIAAAEVRPGVTTDYLDEVVHKACVERNVGTPLIFSLLNEQKLIISVLSISSELCALPKIGLHITQ